MTGRPAGRRVLVVPLVAALAGLALPAAAAEPRSAIPWLSESIREDGPPLPRPPAPPPAPGTEEITVTPLGAVRRDSVGLLGPEMTGLSRALWGPTPAAEVKAMLAAYPDGGVPAARALFRRLLLAEADPPPGDDGSTGLLVARIDRLLADGALEEARALIERAGPDTPELFRRWFDIGLLLDASAEPCAALRQNPALSPTLPARVFCLARGGDWGAAEITLTLGENVGSISPEQQALLARFLDPTIFEGEPEPPIPDPLTPLDFLMREAIGLPRPSGPLPLAFLHLDLSDHAPLRMRIEAAERLVASGAIDPGLLFTFYRAGAPAASGGVWDRAAAVQALDARLTEGDPAGIAESLAAAETVLDARDLAVAFATAYADDLAALDPAAFDAPARARITRLLLLAGRVEAAGVAAGKDPGRAGALVLAVAAPGTAPGTAPGAAPGAAPVTDLERAALSGLAARPPGDTREERLAAMVAEGRQGAALIAALGILQSGATVDPAGLNAALFTLSRAGQGAAARAIATQTLILAATP